MYQSKQTAQPSFKRSNKDALDASNKDAKQYRSQKGSNSNQYAMPNNSEQENYRTAQQQNGWKKNKKPQNYGKGRNSQYESNYQAQPPRNHRQSRRGNNYQPRNDKQQPRNDKYAARDNRDKNRRQPKYTQKQTPRKKQQIRQGQSNKTFPPPPPLTPEDLPTNDNLEVLKLTQTRNMRLHLLAQLNSLIWLPFQQFLQAILTDDKLHFALGSCLMCFGQQALSVTVGRVVGMTHNRFATGKGTSGANQTNLSWGERTTLPKQLLESQEWKQLSALYKVVLMVYHRVALQANTVKDWESIYQRWVFDMPKLIDMCAIYGRKNPQAMSQIINKIFNNKSYHEDLLDFFDALCSEALPWVSLSIEFDILLVPSKVSSFSNVLASDSTNATKMFYRVYDMEICLHNIMTLFPRCHILDLMLSPQIQSAHFRIVFKWIERRANWNYGMCFNILTSIELEIKEVALRNFLEVMTLISKIFLGKCFPQYRETALKTYIAVGRELVKGYEPSEKDLKHKLAAKRQQLQPQFAPQSIRGTNGSKISRDNSHSGNYFHPHLYSFMMSAIELVPASTPLFPHMNDVVFYQNANSMSQPQTQRTLISSIQQELLSKLTASEEYLRTQAIFERRDEEEFISGHKLLQKEETQRRNISSVTNSRRSKPFIDIDQMIDGQDSSQHPKITDQMNLTQLLGAANSQIENSHYMDSVFGNSTILDANGSNMGHRNEFNMFLKTSKTSRSYQKTSASRIDLYDDQYDDQNELNPLTSKWPCWFEPISYYLKQVSNSKVQQSLCQKGSHGHRRDKPKINKEQISDGFGLNNMNPDLSLLPQSELSQFEPYCEEDYFFDLQDIMVNQHDNESSSQVSSAVKSSKKKQIPLITKKQISMSVLDQQQLKAESFAIIPADQSTIQQSFLGPFRAEDDDSINRSIAHVLSNSRKAQTKKQLPSQHILSLINQTHNVSEDKYKTIKDKSQNTTQKGAQNGNQNKPLTVESYEASIFNYQESISMGVIEPQLNNSRNKYNAPTIINDMDLSLFSHSVVDVSQIDINNNEISHNYQNVSILKEALQQSILNEALQQSNNFIPQIDFPSESPIQIEQGNSSQRPKKAVKKSYKKKNK